MRQFSKSTQILALAFGLLALNTLACSDDDRTPPKTRITLPVVVYPTIMEEIGSFDSVTLNAASSPADLYTWADKGSAVLANFLTHSDHENYLVYNYTRCSANQSCHYDHPNDQQVIVDLQIIDVDSSSLAVDDIYTTYREECYYHDEEVCEEVCDTTCYEECTENYEYDYDENGDYYEYYVDTTCVETGCDTDCYIDHHNCWLESVLDECRNIPEKHEITRLTYRASSLARLNISRLDYASGEVVDVWSKNIKNSDTLEEQEPGFGKYPSASTESKFTQKIFDGMMDKVKMELQPMLNFSKTSVRMTLEDDVRLTKTADTVRMTVNMPSSAFYNTYEVRIYSSVKYAYSDYYAYREYLPVTKDQSFFTFTYDMDSFIKNAGSEDSVYVAIYSGNYPLGGFTAPIEWMH